MSHVLQNMVIYTGSRYLQIWLCLLLSHNFILCQSQKIPNLTGSPTLEPTLEPTSEPTLQPIYISHDIDTEILDVNDKDINTNSNDKNGNGPISSEMDKFITTLLPWSIEVDYIFIGIIGILLCCLCCCCISQCHWYTKTKYLKAEVEKARHKTELRIVRPNTPSLKGIPSLSHLTARNSLGNKDNDDYNEDDDATGSSRFFPMFQPRTSNAVRDGYNNEDMAIVEYSDSEKKHIAYIT